MVEHDLAKVGVAKFSLVSRSIAQMTSCCRNSSVGKHDLAKVGVAKFESRFPLQYVISKLLQMIIPMRNSSVGRARPCQGRGREFESRFPLQSFEDILLRE